MSIAAAAKMYGIPRTTLNGRVTGKVQLVARKGPSTALTTEEETSLAYYITYMADRGFPPTREMVQHYAWSIDLRKPEDQRCFGQNGPSLMLWRGFKQRHKDLTVRITESVTKQVMINTSKEILNQYFDLLESTLKENGLQDKPHLIFNCDESAVALNKSSKYVLVPRRNKRAHFICTANSAHISILCAASASGFALPPMVVFQKGLPAGRFHKDGPINAAYSNSESGFVNREIYRGWFLKVFLQYAPPQRPLPLLQDGASTHMGPELIDLAMKNQVVLMCFPPKTTHVLQPCDVGIYKCMKAELRRSLQLVKLLRGHDVIEKRKAPAIIREGFLKAFTPALITTASRHVLFTLLIEELSLGNCPYHWSNIQIPSLQSQQRKHWQHPALPTLSQQPCHLNWL